MRHIIIKNASGSIDARAASGTAVYSHLRRRKPRYFCIGKIPQKGIVNTERVPVRAGAAEKGTDPDASL